MKYLICAQPKSASTSLMRSVGELAGLSFGQQFFLKPAVETRLVKARPRLFRWLNKAFDLTSMPVVAIESESVEVNRLRSAYPTSDYGILAHAHSDIADFTEGTNTQVNFWYDLHKQHFPPTEGNRSLFRGIPKVVLIRNAQETLESYMRVPVTDTTVEFRRNLQSSQRFRENLKREICRWQDGWIEDVEGHGGLILDFDQVVESPVDAIKKALACFGLSEIEVDADYALARERVYR